MHGHGPSRNSGIETLLRRSDAVVILAVLLAGRLSATYFLHGGPCRELLLHLVDAAHDVGPGEKWDENGHHGQRNLPEPEWWMRMDWYPSLAAHSQDIAVMVNTPHGLEVHSEITSEEGQWKADDGDCLQVSRRIIK